MLIHEGSEAQVMTVMRRDHMYMPSLSSDMASISIMIQLQYSQYYQLLLLTVLSLSTYHTTILIVVDFQRLRQKTVLYQSPTFPETLLHNTDVIALRGNSKLLQMKMKAVQTPTSILPRAEDFVRSCTPSGTAWSQHSRIPPCSRSDPLGYS
jgi:hypothetical protein